MKSFGLKRPYWSRTPVIVFLITLVIVFVLSPAPKVYPQSQLGQIESDAAEVQRIGKWEAQASPQASGGSYLYSSGSDAALTLPFSGTALEIIYIAGPSTGTLAIEVDGTVLRTVITQQAQTAYAQSARIDYLSDESHRLRVYAAQGTIAVDAFRVSLPEPATAETDPPSPAETKTPQAENLIVYGEPSPGNDGEERILLLQRDADGKMTQLGHSATHAIQLPPSEPNVIGTRPFVNILCRFGDNPATPRPVPYVEGLMSNVYPGMAQYWPSISNGLLNINGTVTVGWYNLPQPRSYYHFDAFSPNFERILNDCAALADASINFTQFYGINLILNGELDFGTSYGSTGWAVPFDNSQQTYGVTFISASSLGHHQTIAHEMGHAFGLQHPASGLLGSDWDVMGYGHGGCERGGVHPAYGCLAQGMFAYHYYVSEWIPPQNIEVVSVGATRTGIVLERLYAPTNTTNPRLVIIPIEGRPDAYLTIETRQLIGYDAFLPGAGVIISYINHPTVTPPNVVLDADGNGNLNDAGAIWVPSETFTGDAFNATLNGIQVEIVSAGVSSYTVNVRNRPTNIYGDPADKLALHNANGELAYIERPQSTVFQTNPPVSGQWVMGDWNGDGSETPGLYGNNGVFYYTNGYTGGWQGVWFGLLGRPPVVGRFNSGIAHDCLGVVDSSNFPPHGTAFALYFTCDLTPGSNPTKTLQWLSVILPDSQGHTGAFQFVAGDFDGNQTDSIAVRRGNFITWTNVPPTTLLSEFSLAQYFVTDSHFGYGQAVAGDWDNDNVDSFGHYYEGPFVWRDDLLWNSGVYNLDAFAIPINGPVTVSTWRLR